MVYLYIDDNDYIYGYGSENEVGSVPWDQELPEEVGRYLGCYKYNNGEFLLDEKRKNHLVTAERYETEGNAIVAWFTWYDQQIAQYTRCQRLGLEFDHNIEELDAAAVSSQKRLAEIKEFLATPYTESNSL